GRGPDAAASGPRPADATPHAAWAVPGAPAGTAWPGPDGAVPRHAGAAAPGAVPPGAMSPGAVTSGAVASGVAGPGAWQHPADAAPQAPAPSVPVAAASPGSAPSGLGSTAVVPPPRAGADGLPDPLFDAVPSWQPRIIPSPPPQRGGLLRGLLIGLLAGLVAFGGGGFLAGRAVGGSAAPPPPPSPSPTASPELPPYERVQAARNRAKFSGDLGGFSRSWMPYVSGCQKNGDRGGPVLLKGERSKVLCSLGTMNVYFIQYATLQDRDRVRARHLGANIDARELTPGVAAVEDSRVTPSGNSQGSYLEYAYRAGEGRDARTVCALWWDDSDTPVAAYLLAFWKDGVGEDWEPVRDIWRRHA
ncbi:MAG TPA: hypothetical protein VNV66_20190, partial [Pilimelia sp.]|nr:hypothetical protein [Pilimelia sp.]